MNVMVRGLNVAVSDSVGSHIERRLQFALERFWDRIADVQVRLSNMHGKRSGIAKRCQVTVRMRRLPPIRIEETDDDMYVAVDRAADRIGQLVSREVDRARGPVRSGVARWNDMSWMLEQQREELDAAGAR